MNTITVRELIERLVMFDQNLKVATPYNLTGEIRGVSEIDIHISTNDVDGIQTPILVIDGQNIL